MIDEAGLKKLVEEAMTQTEKDEYRNASMVQFREWIEKNPEIQDCRTDDTFLLILLRNKDFRILEAQQTLLAFLKLRQMFPELFRNLDIQDPAIRSIVACGATYTSPYRDNRGRKVGIAFPGKVDPHNCTFRDIVKATILGLQICSEDETFQLLGSVLVADMTGFTTAHVALCPLLEMSTFVRVSKNLFPKSLKEVHIINMPLIVTGFIKFCMSGLSDKMKNKFFFHSSLEELHKVVSTSVLPQEMGGVLPGKTMIDMWLKEIESKNSIILSMDKTKYLGVNEHISQEPVSSGVQGSFRKLVID